MAGVAYQRMVCERDVPAQMRDGTVLRANVYRPESSERLPVLLTRLPYGKDQPLGTTFLDPIKAAAAGYIVVIQDTRGRYHSDGDFTPYQHDFSDGFDTVEWAASLPGANGRVGMFGASYFGMTQFQAASQQPAALRSLFPQITFANQQNGAVRRGGAYELGLQLNWHYASIAFDRTLRQHAGDPAGSREALEALVAQLDRLVEYGYWELPLRDIAGLREAAPFFYEWMLEPADGELWHRLNVALHYDTMTQPAFHLGGWYDIFLDETLRNFRAWRERGILTKLMVGPWAHVAMQHVVGAVDFGLASSTLLLNYTGDLTDLQLRWFDATLKRRADDPAVPPILTEDPVTVFVMGANVWRNFTDWPPLQAHPQTWYLDSGGNANSANGDGTLGLTPPRAASSDSYIYDPAHPVPTVGGALLLPTIYPRGPLDQSANERRNDVLCYTSVVLQHDVTVIGPVSLRVYAASSAVDTDFVARLTAVQPDGRAINLTDGIVRASYRAVDLHSATPGQPTPIEPHRIYAYTIDLWSTAYVFRAGERIRLEVTSSNFPRWDRNLNTGVSSAESSHTQSAQQTIFHDAEHASVLTLHVIEQ